MDTEKLTADEIALYDRQIRLWGMATQLRLRSAKILVINLGAVGTEIVKNLVLGGINSLEILDLSAIKEEDFGAQFFLPNVDDVSSLVGQAKLPYTLDAIRELNNRVTVSSNTQLWLEIPTSYFGKFDLIIATEFQSQSDLIKLNSITRELNIPLYVAGLHGMYGYILNDLILHESVSEKEIGNQARSVGDKIAIATTITKAEYSASTNKETITIIDEYSKFLDILTLPSKKLSQQLNRRQLKRLSATLPLVFALFNIQRPANPEDDVDMGELKRKLLEVCTQFEIPESVISEESLSTLSRHAFTEFSPIAAIVGGTLAQDVIQFLSKKESPINNCLIIDGIKSEMPIYSL